MNDFFGPLLAIATLIVGVAIISVLVSPKSQTAGVLEAFGRMFSNMLSGATGPVTGAVTAPQVSSNSMGFGGLGAFQFPGLQH